MGKMISVETEEGRGCHAVAATGNYGTLCGMSIDDDPKNGRAVPPMIGERIDCADCIAIIRAAKTYRERDFAENLRS